MKNITKNAKTILFASLVATLIISFGETNFAFAEVSEEVKSKALEGKQVWEELVDIKNKEDKTDKEELYESELQKQFDVIAKEMNEHGIATLEQWEKNPDYWRMKNAPTSVTMHGGEALENFKSLNSDTNTSTTPSIHSPCFCPQEFRFIAGFDYLLWGFWPTSAFADTWTAATAPTEDLIPAVESEVGHSYMTPFVKYSLVKAGSASIDMEYSVENPYGFELDSSELETHSVSRYLPNYHTETYDEISNTVAGTDVQIIVDLNTLS